jgi:hypothetical protein
MQAKEIMHYKINERLALLRIIIYSVEQMHHVTAEHPEAARMCRLCNPRHMASQEERAPLRGGPRGLGPGTSLWLRSQSLS